MDHILTEKKQFCRYVGILLITKAQRKQSSFEHDVVLNVSCTYATFLFVYFEVVYLILEEFYFCDIFVNSTSCVIIIYLGLNKDHQ